MKKLKQILPILGAFSLIAAPALQIETHAIATSVDISTCDYSITIPEANLPVNEILVYDITITPQNTSIVNECNGYIEDFLGKDVTGADVISPNEDYAIDVRQNAGDGSAVVFSNNISYSNPGGASILTLSGTPFNFFGEGIFDISVKIYIDGNSGPVFEDTTTNELNLLASTGDTFDDAVPDAQESALLSAVSEFTTAFDFDSDQFQPILIRRLYAINPMNVATGQVFVGCNDNANFVGKTFNGNSLKSQIIGEGYGFSVECASTTVIVFYPGELRADSETIKLAKINDDGTFKEIPNVTATNVTKDGFTGTMYEYTVTDGGELDEDGVVNGTIVDPAGLVNTASASLIRTGGITPTVIAFAGVAMLAVAGTTFVLIKQSK